MGDAHRYDVVDGRVVTHSLEAHIVDHCNLRCWQCCSLSPFHDPKVTEPEVLAEDLRLARQAVSPSIFKLVGGEPLLHPRLLECLEVARESQIAPTISLTTNGILLQRQDDALWRLLDHMTLSIYPKPELSEATLGWIRSQADRFGVELNVKRQDRFEVIHRAEPRADPEATAQIFDRCWLRRRCHTVREGKFFTCTVPQHFHNFWHGDPPYAELDGFPLTPRPGLADALRRYLERAEPLTACARCYGGTGVLEPHRQLTRAEVEMRAAGPM